MALSPRTDELVTRSEALERVKNGAKFEYIAVKVGEKFEYGVDLINPDGTRSEVIMDRKTVPLTFSSFRYLMNFHFDHTDEKTVTVPELPDRVPPKRAQYRRNPNS